MFSMQTMNKQIIHKMKIKNSFKCIAFIALTSVIMTSCADSAASEDEEVAEEKEEMPVLPIDHRIWDGLLKDHVSDGYVKYGDMKKDEAKLDEYLALVSNTPPKDDWTKDQELAYWINAYNAFTVKLILKNADKKLGSIKDLEKDINLPFVNTPWDIKFFEIDGKEMDLNKIEHGIVRKDFDEPRIHFVMVCAAKSCPPLRNEAYVPERLDEQLTAQTKSFLNNDKMNKIEPNMAKVTSLFDWYKKDFKKGDNTVPMFINKYSDTQLNADAEITYMDYDWSLNGDWE